MPCLNDTVRNAHDMGKVERSPHRRGHTLEVGEVEHRRSFGGIVGFGVRSWW